jgi:hypothetical protein
VLRFVWIPVLAIVALYWFRRQKFDEADLNLSIISLFALFMITYGWVTEQTFLDLLPFVFLQIFAYRPKRLHLYFLVFIQILVYAFSSINGGPFIFKPLLERFAPATLTMQVLNEASDQFIWVIRGTLGLIISVSIGAFLLFLVNPSVLQQTLQRLRQTFGVDSS